MGSKRVSRVYLEPTTFIFEGNKMKTSVALSLAAEELFNSEQPTTVVHAIKNVIHDNELLAEDQKLLDFTFMNCVSAFIFTLSDESVSVQAALHDDERMN